MPEPLPLATVFDSIEPRETRVPANCALAQALYEVKPAAESVQTPTGAECA